MSEAAWPLFGHKAGEGEIIAAMESGRLHHAWLVEGPDGIGKSVLAKRFAAVLLGAERVSPDTLDIQKSDPVVQKIMAGAHPDFRWLSRTPNDKGKLPMFISVEDIRESLVEFLTLKPALGGRRVCVLDSLDELNTSGANALLKSLEEPPPHCVLILLHHGQKALLATIRSRCRRLQLGPLGADDMERALKTASGPVETRALTYAAGRPGLALQLMEPDALSALAAAESVVRHLGKGQLREVPAAYSAATRSDMSFHAFSCGVLARLAELAEKEPGFAGDWLWVSSLLDHAKRDSMDRGQTAAKLLSGLQERARSA